MKFKIFQIALFSVLLVVAGCSDKESLDHLKVSAVQNLDNPENNKSITLTTSGSVTFDWEAAKAEDGGLVMNHFYDMGKYHLSYAGMDDAGENSSWFVLTSIGLYPFSPADPSYIVSVPLFDKVKLNLSGRNVVIIKINRGRKIDNIVCGNEKVEGFSISHDNLLKCKKLIINTK